MTSAQKKQHIGLIILVGFAAAVFFHYALGAYRNCSYPYNTFLFTPVDRFNDFFNMYTACAQGNPYSGQFTVYFPFANFIFYLFAFLPRGASFAFYVAAFVLPFLYLSASQLRGGNRYEHFKNVFIFCFLSYPFLFTIDRGNNEGLLFVSLWAFVLMDDRRPILRSLLLAMPIAMKVYPGVFVLLLLAEKKYKQTALTGLWVVILSVASLLCFKGGFTTDLKHAVAEFNLGAKLLAFAWNNQVFEGVGLFFPMKMGLRAIDHFLFPITRWNEIKSAYRMAALLLMGLLSLYVLLIERELWKKTALLVFAMLLFPEMSCDYKLLHIFIPLLLFVNAPRQGAGDIFYASALALLLIPKNYYYLPHFTTDSGFASVHLGCFVNPLIMVVISAVIIASGLRRRRLRERLA